MRMHTVQQQDVASSGAHSLVHKTCPEAQVWLCTCGHTMSGDLNCLIVVMSDIMALLHLNETARTGALVDITCYCSM